MQVFTDKDKRDRLKKVSMDAVDLALKYRGMYIDSKKLDGNHIELTFKFDTQVGIKAFRHEMVSKDIGTSFKEDIDKGTCKVMF